LPADIPDNLIYFQLPVLTPGQPPNCPFQVNDFAAKGSYLYRRSDTEYLWWGAVTNLTRHDTASFGPQDGYFGMISDSVGKFAFVHDQGRVFYLHTLSERYNLLTDITQPETFEEPPVLVPNPDVTPEPDNCAFDKDCAEIVSVLVLVTPEAEAWLGNPGNVFWPITELYLTLGLHSVNFALINSGVPNNMVRFKVERFNFPYTGGEIEDDLAKLRSSSFPDAFNRRDATRSDIVLLLTTARYGRTLGAVTEKSDEDESFYADYGIVTVENMLGKHFVFAHELGHTFNCEHNKASNGGDFPLEVEDACQFGWRFTDVFGKEHLSIMAVPLGSGLGQVLHYSNPNVYYNGVATGTENDFNAREISHSMCRVANLYFDDELRVSIDGPEETICGGTVTYNAVIDPVGSGVPGGPPYTYSWYLDDDPYHTFDDPGVQIGTGPSVLVSSAQARLKSEFWLHLLVQGQNAIARNFKRALNPCCE
jgi:hypothetical protein